MKKEENLTRKEEQNVVRMAVVSNVQNIERNTKPVYVKTAQEIVDLNVREIQMLLSQLLPKTGVAFLCGSSDAGKSYFLLYLAVCICSQDEHILGNRINRVYGSVIIVCTEEAMEDICVRLTKLLEGREIDMEKLRFIFETDNLVEKIKDELEREPADLVILDTFGDLFRGTLNDSLSVRQYLKKYRDLAIDFRCLFLFNHHIGKGKEKNGSPSKNDVLGSQGIESASRVVLDLRKTDQGRRTLTVVKGNHIPEEVKNKGIALGFDPAQGFWKIDGGSVPTVVGKTSAEVDEEEQRVMRYYDTNKTYRKTADELTKDGFPTGKTKVGEIVKKTRPSDQNPKE